MKTSAPFEYDEPVYGDYPALYALGIPTAVNAPAVRRARGRGFAMLSLVGVLAFGLTVVIAWLTL